MAIPKHRGEAIHTLQQSNVEASQKAQKLQQQLETIQKQNKLKQLKLKSQVKKLKQKLSKIVPNKPTGYGGGSKGDGNYVPGQCVWGVYKWLKWVPSGWGSAYQWDESARNAGYYVGPKPKVGAVGQKDGYPGHVVIVLKVGKLTVTVKGMNEHGPYSVAVRTTPTSAWEYIYPR